MTYRRVMIIGSFFLLLGPSAYAYADPSGGALFQILMPMLAAIWGMWLIFANSMRRRLSKLVAKLRGKTTLADAHVPNAEIRADASTNLPSTDR